MHQFLNLKMIQILMTFRIQILLLKTNKKFINVEKNIYDYINYTMWTSQTTKHANIYNREDLQCSYCK